MKHAYECIKYLTRCAAAKWWREYFEGLDGHDYRICLVHRDDLATTFFPLQLTEIRAEGADEERYLAAREKLKSGGAEIARCWYWCVVGYDSRRRIDVVWLFDASIKTEDFKGCSGRLDVTGAGEFCVPDVPEATAGTNGTAEESVDSPGALAAPLEVSVITSSSDQSLSVLFAKLARACHAKLFDLFILRDIDIQEIEHAAGPLKPPKTTDPGDRNIASIMAEDDNYEPVRKWLIEQCGAVPELKIAALATYFPDISSVSESRRARVVAGLTNTVRLAIELKKQGYMPTPIIELVCGSRLDRWERGQSLDFSVRLP